MVGGTVEMWHVHNVILEQQEHVVACMSRMVIEMINIYSALSIVDIKCCGGAGVV